MKQIFVGLLAVLSLTFTAGCSSFFEEAQPTIVALPSEVWAFAEDSTAVEAEEWLPEKAADAATHPDTYIKLPTIEEWVTQNCQQDYPCVEEITYTDQGLVDRIFIRHLLSIETLYEYQFTGDDGLSQWWPGNGSCSRTFVNYKNYENIHGTLKINGTLVAETFYGADH